MRQKSWSSKRIPDTEIRTLWEERQEKGLSLKVLAERKGTTPENIMYLFKSRGLSPLLSLTCAVPECGKRFQAAYPTTTCGSHCSKKLNMRKKNGVEASMILCAFPECEISFWSTHAVGEKPAFTGKGGRDQKFCSRQHFDLTFSRRQSGVYARLLSKKGPMCLASGCGEGLILDEHHEEFSGNKSNKNSKIRWLCPTHHMMIHRGFAKIEKGIFISLVPFISARIKKKEKLFSGYLNYLRG